MYDAILFIVMVSLSGVVLLPALQSNVAVKTSVDVHREHVADEALGTFLATRVDRFSYTVCGDIIDDVAGDIGIDNSSNGLYGSITEWLIGREQVHKTYASLLSENLACQFKMPFSVLGSSRINIFTGDYDRQLKNNISNFLSLYLGDKYRFNLSAKWHPIKGVGFGGEIFVGERPPTVNSHVARSFITMPYSPKMNLPGVGEVILSKYWFEDLFKDFIHDIPWLENITILIDKYASFTKEELKNRLSENLSVLAEGVLCNGFKNEAGSTLFPGILNITLQYGFGKIRTMVQNLTEDSITNALGESLGMIDSFFGGLGGADNPLVKSIQEEITNTIIESLGLPIDTLLTDALDDLENQTRNFTINVVHNILNPYIDSFAESIVDKIYIGQLVDIIKSIPDWLFDRISISKGEVTLTIWEARG
jgi:hypothetical protein